MRQWASASVQIGWLGLDFTEGLARGTFVRETRNAQTWRYKPNGMGDVIPMFNPDVSGRVAITIDRESKLHQQLITLGNADVLTRSIVGPMLITDGNTRSVSVYNKTRIAVIPNLTAGTGPSAVSWVFLFGQTLTQSFGFNANAVGS